ncbi:helix-turn-helix domain-containing protein [Microbulbifer sp.]|uniref:helix-turn-helix domain-containing protein n=1 Tax=Microbulbifer sp. TaxID=1908541 RepID=UPI003F3BA007
MSLKDSIGLRVKTARKAKRLSQVELAEQIGRTMETISSTERGITAPTIETLERLSKALDVPMVEFFEGYDRGGANRKRLELELEIKDLLAKLSIRDLKIAKQQLLALGSRNG